MVRNNIVINDFVESSSEYDDLDNFVHDEEIVFESQTINSEPESPSTTNERNTQSIPNTSNAPSTTNESNSILTRPTISHLIIESTPVESLFVENSSSISQTYPSNNQEGLRLPLQETTNFTQSRNGITPLTTKKPRGRPKGSKNKKISNKEN
ncbi:unnamed protein product [Brachionus calyciflorus]|uniref:Uncharacterized protein n=1 Tax=Brachionus calyciflorus TaxID=104777 RepID=A0A814T243_9BILA|nr:unnamed protein product [Brachionus calyciflorus]